MSRGGEIELGWPDEDRRFRLGIGELRELQELADAGPYQILMRLNDGTWRINDVRETIRLGLVGGGLDHDKARRLVKRYIDEMDRPVSAHLPYAKAILFAALIGPPDEAVAKKKRRAKPPSRTTTDESASPTSTEVAPS